MKLFRNLIIATFIIAILSLILSAIFEFAISKYCDEFSGYISSISLGIFASSLLLFVNGIVGYEIEKKVGVVKLSSYINKLYDSQGIIEYHIPSKVALSDPKCVEKVYEYNETIYMWLVSVLELLSGELLQVRLNMRFINSCGKKQKQYEKINTLILQFGAYIIEYRQKLHETNKSDMQEQKKFEIFQRLNYEYMPKISILKTCMFEAAELREMCGYGKNTIKIEEQN